MTGYPPNWPKCACGKPVLDGHLTCGEVTCSESDARHENILRWNSRFFHVATPREIEDERLALELHYGHRVEIFSIEYPSTSGARTTRIIWKRP
jgi:hypothetical protein